MAMVVGMLHKLQLMVRVVGLEPTSLTGAGFKPAAYTYSTILAKNWCPLMESNHRTRITSADLCH